MHSNENNSRITAEQQMIIDRLRCERLSSNQENMRLVEDFYNKRNDSIAQTLRNEAYAEDEANTIAYYVVKDEEGNLLFYFSLKCGLLYDEFIEGERLTMLKKFYKIVAARQKDANLSDDDRKELDLVLELLRSKKGVKRQQVANVLHKNADNIDIDELFPLGQHNVGKTYSGVELMHFCANEQYHDEWKLKDVKPLGAVVFWMFVVPRVIDIMKIVGCEYLFLFAADTTDDEYLVNYYREYLGFNDKLEHQVAMPLYDLTCKFMCQKTIDLAERREKFFDNFNPDADAI